MKTLLLTLSFLLFAFTTKADVVLDSEGEPLLPGAQYYIYPIVWGPLIGGGLLPGKAGNSTYKTAVLKSFSEGDYGELLRFLPLTKIGIITTDTKMSIEFLETPEGVSSGKWIVVKDLGEFWTVGIGGAEDHGDYETLSGFFQIKKAIVGYQLSFLPEDLNSTLPAVIETDIDYQNNWRLLLTTALPYMVAFIKAPTESSWI